MEANLPPEIAKPWSYNPSSWNQRFRIAILACIAALMALYLGLYQWKFIRWIWDPFFGVGSIRVLDSDLSHEITRWIRIPDAILGVFAYLSDAVFALAGSERRWQDRPWLVILFGLDVIPLGIISAILVVSQGLIVGWWCFFCLVTAFISLALVVLAYDEVVTSCLYLHEIWKKTKDRSLVWNAFWGSPSEEAFQAGIVITKKRIQKNVGPNS